MTAERARRARLRAADAAGRLRLGGPRCGSRRSSSSSALSSLWELRSALLRLKQFILPSPVAIATAWRDLPARRSRRPRSYTLGEIVAGLLIGSIGGHPGRAS